MIVRYTNIHALKNLEVLNSSKMFNDTKIFLKNLYQTNKTVS